MLTFSMSKKKPACGSNSTTVEQTPQLPRSHNQLFVNWSVLGNRNIDTMNIGKWFDDHSIIMSGVKMGVAPSGDDHFRYFGREIVRIYHSRNIIQPDTKYLFITDIPVQDNMAGYAVLGGNYAVLFGGVGLLGKNGHTRETVAHELGHILGLPSLSGICNAVSE